MIRVKNLIKTFRSGDGDVAAIADATIDVDENEIVVLLGPSGSGKTTLLRCVAGLETADRGEIMIGDQVVFRGSERNIPAEQRRIGMVFQSYAIWPHLTVAENVALPLKHGSMGVPNSVVKERVYEALRAVQLSGLEDRPAPNLSGGQQQRVALARALAVKPNALLMDEPLSNLDARLREDVRVEIRDITKQLGVPVLYVTHDQIEALELGDRVAVMDKGRLLQVDTPEGVYNRPANSTVANFLGSINWFEGRSAGKGRMETPFGMLTVTDNRAGGCTMAQLGIRPEKIDLSLSPVAGANVFTARCTGISFLGDHKLYRVQIGSTPFVVKQSGKLPPDCVGAEVHVTFPEDSVLVFPDENGAKSPEARARDSARPEARPVDAASS